MFFNRRFAAKFHEGKIIMNRISIMVFPALTKDLYAFGKDRDLEKLKRTYDGLLSDVKAAGYVGTDMFAYETMIFGEDFVKEKLAANELVAASYIYFDKFATSHDNFEKECLQNAKRAAETAKKLGAKVLMLVPSAHEGIEEFAPSEIRKNLIANFTPVTAYAKTLVEHVVVEDTPDLRLCFCKAREVEEVLDSVPGLELVYDSGNMILDGEDPIEYIDSFIGKIGHVHIKDMEKDEDRPRNMGECMRDGTPMKAAPTGTGVIGIDKVITKLKDIGYGGGLCVEFANHKDADRLESFKKSIEYVQEYLQK